MFFLVDKELRQLRKETHPDDDRFQLKKSPTLQQVSLPVEIRLPKLFDADFLISMTRRLLNRGYTSLHNRIKGGACIEKDRILRCAKEYGHGWSLMPRHNSPHGNMTSAHIPP